MLSGGNSFSETRDLTIAKTASSNTRKSRHVLVVYALLAVGSLTTFGLLQIFMEYDSRVGQLELLGALTILVVLGGLRVTNNLDIARSCFLLTMIALLIVMLVTGGTGGTGILWCFMFPVAAFFLAGKLEGTSWVIFLMAIIFLLWAISKIYNIPLYYDDIATRQLLVTLLVVSVALYVYQGSRETWELQARHSQHQLQENIRQMAALHAKVDYAKSEFVTLASHQLRTPISAIGWNSEMLLSGDIGELTHDQAGYVQGVYDSNRRLSVIVDSMLLVSSLELGTLSVRPESMDLAAFMRKLLSEELKKHDDKKLEITQNFASDVPKIKLDPHIARQIFRNLFSNAIKYTPDGGQVAISVERVDKKLLPGSKGSVQIIVSDSGYGIPQSDQKNVFAKLFRAANIKAKDVDGTGLGLYIVKALVDEVGGSVSFESEENKGSTFTVMLPLEGMPSKAGGKENGNELRQ